MAQYRIVEFEGDFTPQARFTSRVYTPKWYHWFLWRDMCFAFKSLEEAERYIDGYRRQQAKSRRIIHKYPRETIHEEYFR